jgi:DNA replication protein DnaC
MAESDAACAACTGELDQCGGRHGRGTVVEGVIGDGGRVSIYYRTCEPYRRALETVSRRETEQRRAELFRVSRIPDGTEHMTFDTFIPTPGTKKALEAAAAIAEGKGRKGLCLAGPTRRGKTHLLMGVLRYRAEHGDGGAEYHVLAELLKDWRATYDASREIEFMDYLRRVPILVLDDIGAEKVSDWGLEQLYLLLNWRELDGTMLLAACNYSVPSELEDHLSRVEGKYLPSRNITATRIVSRIRGLCRWVEVSGPNYQLHGPDMFEKEGETP